MWAQVIIHTVHFLEPRQVPFEPNTLVLDPRPSALVAAWNMIREVGTNCMKGSLPLGWPKSSFGFLCKVALVVLSCL